MIRYHFRSNIQMRRTPANLSTAILLLPRITSPYSPAIRLCLGEGTTDLGTALAGRETSLGLEGGLGTLLDLLIGLGEDELDVAGVGHVGVDLEKSLADGRKKNAKTSNIHDREHGKCGGGPWEPG